MRGDRYEVIVVGGGPAGGITAYELARRGVRVVVLERERLPRYKACAGGLTSKTVQLLDFDLSPAFEEEITSAKYTYMCESPVAMDFGEVAGWTAMRAELDHLILQEAVSAGALLLEEQRVRGVEFQDDGARVNANGHTYFCSMLVGADGANSVVARDTGLMNQRRLAVALEAEMEVAGAARPNKHGCVQLDFGCVPGGYGWVFPKREVLSVGVGTFLGRPAGLRASFRGFLERLGLTYDPRRASMRGHLVPLGGRDHTLHRGRVLLVGDAASLAEPLTGEGIYYAIKSAQIAANTICQALDDGRGDLSSYTRRVHQEITQDLKYAARLAALLYRFPRVCYRLVVKSPSIQWGMANVLRGRSSFQNLYDDPRLAPRISYFA